MPLAFKAHSVLAIYIYIYFSFFFFVFCFYNFAFIDKTYITVAKFKTKRKCITILQIASKLHKDEKE